MKHLLLLLYFLKVFLLPAQTCDYQKLFNEGQAFAKQRQYKKALYKYNSARRCDTAKGDAVDAAIEALLEQVEGEKNAADKERKRAEKALAEVEKQQNKNEKIINAFYFYADKFALAYKDEHYGFINKEGKAVIDYQYDEAIPFDETGYAKVRFATEYFLLDTNGQQYPLATEISRLSPEITALDLRNKDLDSIPAIVFKQTQLRVLWLSGNRLTTLPAEIGNLTQLESLELAENRLISLPKEIGQLKHLRSLNLSTDLSKLVISLANSFVVQPAPDINNVYSTDSKNSLIDMLQQKNRFSVLPVEISALEMLSSLNLANTGFTTIPPEYIKLQELRAINLAGNNLKEIPELIFQWTNLQTLNLSQNTLSELPPQIKRLKNLQRLNLADNHLEVLPPEIGSLEKLEELYIGDNNLSTLPNEIGRLKNLKWLLIASISFDLAEEANGFSSQPDSLNPVIPQNPIGNGWVDSIAQLKSNTNTLPPASFRISSLPAVLEQLKKLEYLDLTGHNLTQLPAGIQTLKKLQGIDLTGNPVKPAYVAQLKNAMPWCEIYQ